MIAIDGSTFTSPVEHNSWFGHPLHDYDLPAVDEDTPGQL